VADGIATVTMNRPDQRNAMNTAMLVALRAAFDDLDRRSDVRVVVVRGAGSAFCAGMDLKDMESRGGARDPEADVVGVLQRVERSRHPTIALVHGDAIAGGCELALHCDLRVMADTARIGMPLARIGFSARWTSAGRSFPSTSETRHARASRCRASWSPTSPSPTATPIASTSAVRTPSSIAASSVRLE